MVKSACCSKHILSSKTLQNTLGVQRLTRHASRLALPSRLWRPLRLRRHWDLNMLRDEPQNFYIRIQRKQVPRHLHARSRNPINSIQIVQRISRVNPQRYFCLKRKLLRVQLDQPRHKLLRVGHQPLSVLPPRLRVKQLANYIHRFDHQLRRVLHALYLCNSRASHACHLALYLPCFFNQTALTASGVPNLALCVIHALSRCHRWRPNLFN